MMTRPGRSPRPARPAICVSNWNVRSAERKSGMLSARSAFTTAANVTPGKSKPLVIICVPTRISISPARSSASIRARAPLGAKALALEPVAFALRAGVGRGGMIAAVMASQRAVAHVKCHADAAVRARDNVPADVALQKIVKAAAIEKHHALAA